MRNGERLKPPQSCRRSAAILAARRRSARAEIGSSRTIIQSRSKGSDNIIAFTTKRYSRTPLVVQGPGAAGMLRRWAFFRYPQVAQLPAALDPETFPYAFQFIHGGPAS